jgi:hypothetical protein
METFPKILKTEDQLLIKFCQGATGEVYLLSSPRMQHFVPISLVLQALLPAQPLTLAPAEPFFFN